MARNKKVEILSHSGEVLHPITDGDCVIFSDGETLTHKLSEDEAVMYTPEVVNSSPMFKVGEGDSSDYSANVLDGAYQEAVLKGQTYVNTIQEPSADVITLPTPFTEYERTQSKTFTEMQDGTFGLNLVGQSYVNCIQEPSEPSYVALGEALEFQNKKVEYTNDGQIKSAMLKGQTLVNISKPAIRNGNTVSTYDNIGTTYQILKPKTKYFCYIENLANDTFTYYINNQSFDIASPENQRVIMQPNSIITRVETTIENPSSIGLWLSVSSLNEATEKQNLRIMLIEYQEGMENWDIPYFQGMQSVTMSTELENVCSRYNSGLAKGGKTFTVGSINDRTLKLADVANIGQYNFKQNTKYLIQFKIANLNLDGLSSTEIRFYTSSLESGNCLFENGSHVKVSKNGIYRAVFTTTSVINTSSFEIKGVATEWENSTSTSRTLTISQIMCIEYQNGMENWDLPYFETKQLMKPLKVRSVNKNLFDTANMFNSYKTTVSEVTTNSFRLTGTDSNATYKNTPFIFNVKPNTDYKITFKSETTDADALCDVYDANNKYLGNRNFNSGNNTRVSVRFYVNMNNTKNGTVKYYDIQMEESLTETPYAPHQSKTISALEPITLRAIGDVKDTLDLSTGEYVQRIGELVLDGSQSWYAPTEMENVIWAECAIELNKFKKGSPSTAQLCDKFIFEHSNEDREHIRLNAGEPYASRIRIFINKTKLSAYTSDAINEYIKSIGGLKFQAELANPITRKISLEYPNLQTYTDITHVQSIAMDGTLIPKIFLPSDISYKTLLKPNTSYNVIIDREVIDSTNQLTVNLGGTTANITANRTVVRTPSTLSNETLTFSGKDNRLAKAMLIEGSTLINGDLPHFDGIGDVKLGRVVENLCMANESYAGSSATTNTLTNNEITCKVTSAGSRVVLFDFTKPIQNGKKYFVYAPCSKMFAIGIRTFYNSITYYDVAKTNITNYAILSVDNSILNDCKLFIGQLGAMEVNSTMTIRRPIVCEYIKGMENWDWESIGYFTGTKNIGNEFMRIGNKNLFDLNAFKDKIKNESCFTILDNGFKADSSKGSVGNFLRDKYKFAEGIFKENTQYTISFDTTHEGNLYLSPFVAYTDGTSEGIAVGGNGKRTLTTAINKTVKLFSVTWSTQANGGKSTLTNIQIEEASSATSYVAHKHNSLHILPNEQIPLTFVQGATIFSTTTSFAEQSNNTMASRIRTGLLDLEPNETYRISCGDKNYIQATAFYNNSNIGAYTLGGNSDDCIFTTTKDVHKICINIAKSDLNSNITPSVLHQVRLEKVTDVTLRSVGNVKDELDLTRGVYIQRIYEMILDGSQGYWWYDYDENSSIKKVQITTPSRKLSATSTDKNINCDKLIAINFTSSNGEMLAKDTKPNTIALDGWSQSAFLCFSKELLPTNDINILKQYLSQNPITVQYVLETPIEHKINIPMKNESNQTIAKPNGIFTLPLMYSETNHVNINSQIYPKVQSRDYIAYPVIASPSNKYTVFHNKVGSTDLTVNLCGASTTVNAHKNTITTPSSISQYELRLSGANNKVSNVCVFNGDYMNVNVPYVQGMMNAVNPTVKNIGKNLIINEFMQGYYEGGNGVYVSNHSKFVTTANLIPVNPNMTYIQSSSLNVNNGAITFFDKNKKYIKQITNVLKSSFITPSNCYYLSISWWENGGLNPQSIEWAMLEQSSTSSRYEPYKENNCKPENGQVYLTQDMFEQGSMSGVNGAEYDKGTSNARIRTKELIKIKSSTSYIFKMNDNYNVWIKEFDVEGKQSTVSVVAWLNNGIFTTKENTEYISFIIRKGTNNTSISVSEFDNINPFLCELDKEIHLRSLPNGVCDELNLQTGEYIQRVGEVVLDGSGDENITRGIDDTGHVNTIEFYINNIIDSGGSRNPICDSYIYGFTNADFKHFYTSFKRVVVFIEKTELLSQDVNGFKEWLSKNPITVQYQLVTPIIKQIDINNFPHSYKDGHVIIESNDPSTNVTAQMTYRCVTNRSGQIQEHTEQVEKQERQINELETLILENIRQNQNRSQNFLTSLISTLEIEEE